MPPKKKIKMDKPAEMPTNETFCRCEWGECMESMVNIENFLRHVTSHISGYYSTLGPQHTDVFECKWRECGSQLSGNATDFNRHVYFHAFHVKIKNAGAMIVESLGIQSCKLDNHSRNLIPELPERLHCGWVMCEMVFDNPEYFYRHMDMHANNFPEGNHVSGGCRCLWEGCEVVVKSKHRVKEHLRSHTQEKMVACPVCGALFANRTKFVDHLKRQGNLEVQCYECSHCNKRFGTERLLRDHMRQHVNHYKCPYCDMTCPTPSGLRSHFRYRHTNDRPYKCDQCDYTGKSAHDLRRHMDTHTIVKMYQCHITDCKFQARCYAALAHHFNKEHQGMEVAKFACHVCNSVFTRGHHLTKHLKQLHKFKWPSGHSRFRYKSHEDGFQRLQTVRYESVELMEQVDPSLPVSSSKASQNQENVVPENSNNDSTQSPIPQESVAQESVAQEYVAVDQSEAEAVTTSSTDSQDTEISDTVNMAYNLEMLGDVALHGPTTRAAKPVSSSQFVQSNPVVSLASSGLLPSDVGTYTFTPSAGAHNITAISLPGNLQGITAISIQENGEAVVTHSEGSYLPLQPALHSEYVVLNGELCQFPSEEDDSDAGQSGGEADIVNLQLAAAEFGIAILDK